MPERTLKAFADHGDLSQIMLAGSEDWKTVLDEFATAGIGVYDLATRLQDEGTRSLVNSRDQFSGSDDPVGQRLEGARRLIERYRSAGITSIAHDFYSAGRHEMLHVVNRREVFTNLLVWISGTPEKVS